MQLGLFKFTYIADVIADSNFFLISQKKFLIKFWFYVFTARIALCYSWVGIVCGDYVSI